MFHCSLTSPPTGRSLQINKPQQSTSINKWVRGLELPGMRWGRVAECSKALPFLSPNARASNALYRQGAHSRSTEVSVEHMGKGGESAAQRWLHHHLHTIPKISRLSSSANYRGRKSALASSVLIQPNKICVSLSRWDYFFFNLYLL